jgi:hypothetical protein
VTISFIVLFSVALLLAIVGTVFYCVKVKSTRYREIEQDDAARGQLD